MNIWEARSLYGANALKVIPIPPGLTAEPSPWKIYRRPSATLRWQLKRKGKPGWRYIK